MTELTITVTLAGLGLTVVLAVAAWRSADRAGRLLSAFLVCLAAQMAANSLLASGQLVVWPHLAQVHVPLAFALGPLLFLYARALAKRPFSRWTAAHFLPSAAVLVLLMPFYFTETETKRAMLAAAIDSYPREWRVRQLVLIVQMGVYVAAAARLRREALAPPVSRWAGTVLRATPYLWALTAIRFAVAYDARTATIPMAAAAAVVGLVVTSSLAGSEPRQRRRAGSGEATGAEGDACLASLIRLMTEREAFRDRQLTLESLADAVRTTPHFLSRVVNERCGRTVPDFINGYRVEAVKRALSAASRQGESIQAIAESCGFSSRSTFNAAFRRHTGRTPGDFRAGTRAES